jgi:hypothetical protein
VRSRRLLAALLVLVVLLGPSPGAFAQSQPGTAEAKRVTGRVEVLRKGQTQWLPVVVGARLAEGDNVRALQGASAELELPDGSTLMVAENSRIIVTKVQTDPQNQSRFMVFHLVAGKVVATISQATLTLVRARQSNFVITTPTAVAAARGTEADVSHDADKNITRVAVLQKDPSHKGPPSVITCSSFYDRFRTVVVTEGNYTEVGTQGCQPPKSNTLLPDYNTLGTATNPIPATPQQIQQLSAPASPPPIFETPGVVFAPVQALLQPAAPLSDVSAAGVVPIGVDLGASQNVDCETPPCL